MHYQTSTSLLLQSISHHFHIMPNVITTDADCKVYSSTLRQFAASARFDGNVRSETSGGVSAVQRHQRMRAHENSHSPRECIEGAATVEKMRAKGRREWRNGGTSWNGSRGREHRPRERSAAPRHVFGFALRTDGTHQLGV